MKKSIILRTLFAVSKPSCNGKSVCKDSRSSCTVGVSSNRFAAVRAAVAARAKDLMKISVDQAAFAAQRDLPNGKTTMNAYLWKVCGEEYDQEHQG